MSPRPQTTTQYDINEVDGIDKLRDRIKSANTIEDWSFILQDYIKFGNNKIADSIAIFNFNTATDCMNRGTEHCQVPSEACYAYKDENIWKDALAYRRRQEYLWDCLDAETWAKAFLQIVDRKLNDVNGIRFSESGDFRHRGDIIKVDWIAQIVGSEDINVYTYSASDWLDWSEREHFTLNASNPNFDDGEANRRYMAIPESEDLPEGAVWCPFDYYDGDDLDERPKCGECMLCINQEGPDVAIELHAG